MYFRTFRLTLNASVNEYCWCPRGQSLIMMALNSRTKVLQGIKLQQIGDSCALVHACKPFICMQILSKEPKPTV